MSRRYHRRARALRADLARAQWEADRLASGLAAAGRNRAAEAAEHAAEVARLRDCIERLALRAERLERERDELRGAAARR